MAPAEYSGITLQVGQERTANITVQPAAVATEVRASGGDLAVVDVSSAAIGANVSSRGVAQLPINWEAGVLAVRDASRRRKFWGWNLRRYSFQRPVQRRERHPLRRLMSEVKPQGQLELAIRFESDLIRSELE